MILENIQAPHSFENMQVFYAYLVREGEELFPRFRQQFR